VLLLPAFSTLSSREEMRPLASRFGQAKRYARDIKLTPDETEIGSPWLQGLDQFRVPSLFVTNGRP
jgi:type I restriction enzyme R subunit